MVAGARFDLGEVDIDLLEAADLRALVKKCIGFINKEETAPGEVQAEEDEEGYEVLIKTFEGFGAKNVGKPIAWDGEDEEHFKNWQGKLTTFMATAGDKSWKTILVNIQNLKEDFYFDTIIDVKAKLKNWKVNPDLAEDLLDSLYDQLTQYTTGELLADSRTAGPEQSFESYRKAFAYGKKKTAENIHRARNRVTRPQIAEKMEHLEEKFKLWKKDIAYIKNIDAYDMQDQSMISILLDFIPDEAHKEITTKYETTGSKASSLKTVMIEVEKIIAREKERKLSRQDRKTTSTGRLAFTAEVGPEEREQDEEYYIWDQQANYGFGGFVAAAMKRGRDDGDDDPDSPGSTSEEERSAKALKGGGKGKGYKGQGKTASADRKCYLCGEGGHFKAACPQRWYVPKTVFGSWWNSLPFQKGSKGKGKGKSFGSFGDYGNFGKSAQKGIGKGGKGKSYGKGFQTSDFIDMNAAAAVWANEWEPPCCDEWHPPEEAPWKPIGAVMKKTEQSTRGTRKIQT